MKGDRFGDDGLVNGLISYEIPRDLTVIPFIYHCLRILLMKIITDWRSWNMVVEVGECEI